MGEDSKKSNPDMEFHRFGSIAVYRKYVSLGQVQRALAIQIEENINGTKHRFLGDILLENRWITEEQVKSILSEMGAGKK